MNDLFIVKNREGWTGVVIKKLPHPYNLPIKITIKMRGAEFL